jgi:histone acetyltransferase (RNA polymerase elongator complex component)
MRRNIGKKKMRHINIPVFIPHLGCPNDCVFCNQRSISGHGDFNISSVRREIEDVLSTVGEEDECEIAFFGGSFTGIERSLMISLLDIAEEYIKKSDGLIRSVRLSTRPDYISEEILDVLGRYSVRTIELGLQSMDDGVLSASKRGHDSLCAKAACRMIKQRGFELIGQMMIGLPHSDLQKEIATAKAICEMGADGARVYPTVVFHKSELADITLRGDYAPLEMEDAVMRCARVLDVFDKAGVPCIRVGLCASENLCDEEQVLGGASHAAIGEMAMNELYFERICQHVDSLCLPETNKKTLEVYVKKGNVSKAVGQKGKNKARLCQKYNFARVKVLEKNDIIGYNIYINII